MRTILIVDDIELNRDTIKFMLDDSYRFLEASNGAEALDLISARKDEIDAIILDIIMPVMDGIAVLQKMHDEELTEKIPVLIISAESDSDLMVHCFELGAYDFIAKPFKKSVTAKRLENAIALFSSKNKLSDRVAEQTRKLTDMLDLQEQLITSLKTENSAIIDILGMVVESRNVESGQHIARVKEYTRILGKHLMRMFPEYGLTDEQLHTIVAASPLHDIGKIAVPDSVLLKPGKLTAEEFEIIKTHTTKGAELLKQIQNIWINDDAEFNTVSSNIARYHHERYTGKGYPDGLSGEDIPLCAQIVGVADVYDALVNERCYKDAFSAEKAFSMIINGECGAFSPKMIEALCSARTEFEAVHMNASKKPDDITAEQEMLRLHTDVAREVLTKTQLGIWEIVLPDQGEPQLYGDAVLQHLMGAPSGLTPEQYYQFWISRVPQSEEQGAMQYFVDIQKNGSAEHTYRWNHPQYGERYVRCGGYVKPNHKGGTLLHGYHRDVDLITRQKNGDKT